MNRQLTRIATSFRVVQTDPNDRRAIARTERHITPFAPDIRRFSVHHDVSPIDLLVDQVGIAVVAADLVPGSRRGKDCQ
ncbi:hypothetical protein J2X34_002982 [Rhodococcus sp. BE178]